MASSAVNENSPSVPRPLIVRLDGDDQKNAASDIENQQAAPAQSAPAPKPFGAPLVRHYKSGICLLLGVAVFAVALVLALTNSLNGVSASVGSGNQTKFSAGSTLAVVGIRISPANTGASTDVTSTRVQSALSAITGTPMTEITVAQVTTSLFQCTVAHKGKAQSIWSPLTTAASTGDWRLLAIKASKVINEDEGKQFDVCKTCGTTLPPSMQTSAPGPTFAPPTASPVPSNTPAPETLPPSTAAPETQPPTTAAPETSPPETSPPAPTEPEATADPALNPENLP
jgi:hypothetical protein